MTLALNGDSIVNPFSDVLDKMGLTPKGRARKEQENETRHFRESMAQLEERRIRFQQELDRREQACIEALHENEEQMREARKELQQIRDRAYEITLPDGTSAKVYRDGDKVRMENGAEVGREVVKAEDLGDQRPSWSEFTARKDRIEQLQTQREEIIRYQDKLHDTEQRAKNGRLAADEIDNPDKQLNETMPEAVRRHCASAPESGETPDVRDAAPQAGTGPGAPFARAASSSAHAAVLSAKDFEITPPPPPASALALK